MDRRARLLGFLALVGSALLLSLPIPNGAQAAARSPLAVIVNASTTKLSEISTATLRRAFRGEVAETPEGKRLVPLNGALRSPERERFDRKVMGLAPDEVARFWIDRRIRDEGLPPRTVPAELIVRVVASYPNAIGYVALDRIGKGVRTLRVDGKLPSDAGYLFAEP